MATVDSTAPVIAAAEARVEAGAETVWRVLTDINRWPEWNPDVKSASLEGELAEGAVFRWKAGPGKIVSTVLSIQYAVEIAWAGKTTGIKAVHVWRLEQKAGGLTAVETEESWSGILPAVLRWPARRILRNSLVKGLERLKAESERLSRARL